MYNLLNPVDEIKKILTVLLYKPSQVVEKTVVGQLAGIKQYCSDEPVNPSKITEELTLYWALALEQALRAEGRMR